MELPPFPQIEQDPDDPTIPYAVYESTCPWCEWRHVCTMPYGGELHCCGPISRRTCGGCGNLIESRWTVDGFSLIKAYEE